MEEYAKTANPQVVAMIQGTMENLRKTLAKEARAAAEGRDNLTLDPIEVKITIPPPVRNSKARGVSLDIYRGLIQEIADDMGVNGVFDDAAIRRGDVEVTVWLQGKGGDNN